MVPSFFLFLFMYMVSFIMVMSGEDWFLIWLGLEINMMAFLVLVYRRYSMECVESCMKYFFIQSMGSALLIGILYSKGNFVSGISTLVLSLKVGAGPFFYWFPSVCSGLSWSSCYVLMLFQKVLPLCLIFILIHWLMWIILMMGLLIGMMGSFNQVNIKSLMAYSSIHHLGWIFILGMSGNMSWMLYLFFYGLVLMIVVMYLFQKEINYMSEMFKCKNSLWFMISMLSMGGMPPLLGFFLKWLALINVMEMSVLFLGLLVMVSVVMLYIYMRLVYNIIMGGGVDITWSDDMSFSFKYMVDIISMMGMFMGLLMIIFL